MTSPPRGLVWLGVMVWATTFEARKRSAMMLSRISESYDPRPQPVLHFRRHLRPVVLEVLRGQLPRVPAQQHDRENRHEVRGEVEAGAAVARHRPGALRREGVPVPPLP